MDKSIYIGQYSFNPEIVNNLDIILIMLYYWIKKILDLKYIEYW